jgi:hypothetical protein
VKSSAYLQAVAKFLGADVRPRLEDRALAFRVLIASSLLASLALESEHAGALEAAEAERLAALGLGDVAALAQLLRGDALPAEQDAAVFAHLIQTLRERLQAVTPRFDTAPEIES